VEQSLGKLAAAAACSSSVRMASVTGSLSDSLSDREVSESCNEFDRRTGRLATVGRLFDLPHVNDVQSFFLSVRLTTDADTASVSDDVHLLPFHSLHPLTLHYS